jgi:hypothetical protein
MRVICAHTSLHPLARLALERYASQAEYFPLRPSALPDEQYWRLLNDIWREGQAFLNVEHDIEIHGDVLPQVEACPEPWCVFSYYGGADGAGNCQVIDGSLGCVRFSADMLTAEPTVFDDLRDCNGQLACRDWHRLDVEIKPALIARGYAIHHHEPMVLHHHVYLPKGCACGGVHE